MRLCRMIDGVQRTKALTASFERVPEPLDRLLGMSAWRHMVYREHRLRDGAARQGHALPGIVWL